MNRLLPHIIFLILGIVFASYALAATVWTQQPGTYNWYKSGTLNKYPTTNPLDFVIPASWVKQDNITYIQCKSTGGTNRYFPQGYDCNTGKPKVVTCEAFICKGDFGITFDLSQNTVLTCPRVTITKEQLALIYDGIKAEGLPSCK